MKTEGLKSDKRNAILKSVLKLVNREGFYHLNMKNIAAEANVAAGTIYLYFKGKEELINALYAMVVQEFNNSVIKGYEESRHLKANFYEMMRRALEFYLHNPDHFSFTEQYTYAPFLFKENQDQNFLLFKPIYKMIAEGKKKKMIKNIPEVILLSIIHGSLNTIIKMHLAKKINLKSEIIRNNFYDAVWEAIVDK
jgi:AcrR family transcriptional regulator